jgi:ribosome-associated protein YbcJ (S4-like RNA binding protein)
METSETVLIRGDMITLGQFIKVIGLATGGGAKEILEGGHVEVNCEPESRRGRKLFAGDVVAVDGYRKWTVATDDAIPPQP